MFHLKFGIEIVLKLILVNFFNPSCFYNISDVGDEFMLIYGLVFDIINLVFTIMLRNKWVFLAQLALIVGFYVGEGTGALLLIQILFLFFMIYRFVIAIEYNYQLIMEKTHQHI